jgi:hypothetical protein
MKAEEANNTPPVEPRQAKPTPTLYQPVSFEYLLKKVRPAIEDKLWRAPDAATVMRKRPPADPDKGYRPDELAWISLGSGPVTVGDVTERLKLHEWDFLHARNPVHYAVAVVKHLITDERRRRGVQARNIARWAEGKRAPGFLRDTHLMQAGKLALSEFFRQQGATERQLKDAHRANLLTDEEY